MSIRSLAEAINKTCQLIIGDVGRRVGVFQTSVKQLVPDACKIPGLIGRAKFQNGKTSLSPMV